MSNQNKENKTAKGEIIANVLWVLFGVIGGIDYYSKAEYWISGILSLIALFYTYRLIKLLM